MTEDVFDFRDKLAEFYRNRIHDRWSTFQMALNWTFQTGGSNIIETGCIRSESYQDGASTRLFADFAKRRGNTFFWSVDIEPRHIETARRFVEPSEFITLVVGDSVEFLKSFMGRIDLLYLDSFDYDRGNPAPAQLHASRELQAAMPKLGPKACVLIDDNDPIGGGKGELAKRFLRDNRFICLLDHFQSCWVRV
jgi:hypothetical protein